MTQKKIDEAVLAQLRMEHRLWLQLPQTRRFIAALRALKQEWQDSASKSSVITQIGNAKEHNQNVKAAAVLHILETYADPTTYPYSTDPADPANGPTPINA